MNLPNIETQSLQEIKYFQEAELAKHLSYLKSNSKFYQSFFALHKIDISSIKTLEDLAKIPCTTKEDLQLHNKDFICVDTSEIIDYITTSGTLGEPVTFALTEKDLQRLSYNECYRLQFLN